MVRTLVGGNSLVVIVALCSILPVVLLSAYGGALADRLDRRRVMLAADGLRIGTTSALAFVAFGADPNIWLMCALIAVANCGTAILIRPTPLRSHRRPSG